MEYFFDEKENFFRCDFNIGNINYCAEFQVVKTNKDLFRFIIFKKVIEIKQMKGGIKIVKDEYTHRYSNSFEKNKETFIGLVETFYQMNDEDKESYTYWVGKFKNNDKDFDMFETTVIFDEGYAHVYYPNKHTEKMIKAKEFTNGSVWNNFGSYVFINKDKTEIIKLMSDFIKRRINLKENNIKNDIAQLKEFEKLSGHFKTMLENEKNDKK